MLVNHDGFHSFDFNQHGEDFVMSGFWIERIGPGFEFSFEVTDGNHSKNVHTIDQAMELIKDLNKHSFDPPPNKREEEEHASDPRYRKNQPDPVMGSGQDDETYTRPLGSVM
jgi:hypothetical protein